jgi:hypothetical protein
VCVAPSVTSARPHAYGFRAVEKGIDAALPLFTLTDDLLLPGSLLGGAGLGITPGALLLLLLAISFLCLGCLLLQVTLHGRDARVHVLHQRGDKLADDGLDGMLHSGLDGHLDCLR